MSDEEIPPCLRNLGNRYCSNLCRPVAGMDRLVEAQLPFCLMIEAEGGTIINTVRVTAENVGALTFVASKTSPKASGTTVWLAAPRGSTEGQVLTLVAFGC